MHMKKILMTMVLGALVAYLVPSYAQSAQEWQSTSTMKGAGSAYSSQVTAVGATGVISTATTTESNSSSGPRRAKKDEDDWADPPEVGEPGGSPIGDAVLPLMLMLGAYGAYVVIRTRKRKQA